MRRLIVQMTMSLDGFVAPVEGSPRPRPPMSLAPPEGLYP